MHLAKKFFLVCSGLFLLAVGCELFAQRAQAQASGSLRLALAASANCGGLLAADDSGRIFTDCGGTWQLAVQAPGPIADIVSDTQLRLFYVVQQNGNVYVCHMNGFCSDCQPWTLDYHGNVYGGPVNGVRHSLGQLKARFRDPVQPNNR